MDTGDQASKVGAKTTTPRIWKKRYVNATVEDNAAAGEESL
jgi:hypothetical protein